MATPDSLPDTPDVESGPTRNLSNMFGGTLNQEDGLNEMIANIYRAWVKLGVTPVADTLQGWALVGDANGHGIWVPQSAFRNVLIQGDPLPLQLEGNGPFTSATTPVNNDSSYVFDIPVLLSDGNDIFDCSVVTTGLPLGTRAKYRLDVETANKKGGLCWIVEQADIADIVAAGCCSLSWDQQITGTSINGVRALILAWTGTADSPTRDVVNGANWGAAGTLPTLATNWAVATNGDSAVIVPTTSWVTNAISNATIGSNVTNIAVLIYVDDLTTSLGDFFEITNVCLVPGPAPLRVPRQPVAVEQNRTRYLYQVFGGLNANQVIGYASATGTGTALSAFTFSPMRKAPATPTLSAVGDWGLTDAAGTAQALTGHTAFSVTRESYNPLLSVASGLVAGASCNWQAKNTLNARLRLDARF